MSESTIVVNPVVALLHNSSGNPVITKTDGSITVSNGDTSLNVVLKDQDGVNLAIQHDATIPQNSKGILMMGIDNAGTAQRLALTDDGRLITSTAVQAPPNRTTVNTTAKSSINSTTGVDTDYTIPVGANVTIQQLSAGSEYNSSGSKVELYYSPDAAKTNMSLISVLYINGNSATEPISYDVPTGTGNNRVVLRRVRFGSSSAEVFAKWSGYY